MGCLALNAVSLGLIPSTSLSAGRRLSQQTPASNIFPSSRAPRLPRARDRDKAQSFRFHFALSLTVNLPRGSFYFCISFCLLFPCPLPLSPPSLYAALGVLIVFFWPLSLAHCPKSAAQQDSLVSFVFCVCVCGPCLCLYPFSAVFLAC